MFTFHMFYGFYALKLQPKKEGKEDTIQEERTQLRKKEHISNDKS